MQFIALGVAVLAIATIYYIWRTYREVKTHRARILRERVAFMVWQAADSTPTPAREMAGTHAD